MFNNYAIVQGVDHIVPVDMYLPGCPPRPEMLIDAILRLHEKILHEPLGDRRRKMLEAREAARRRAGRARRARCRPLPVRQGAAGRVGQGRRRGPRGAAAHRELDEGRRAAGERNRPTAQREPPSGEKPQAQRRAGPATPAVGATSGAPAELPPASSAGRGMFGVTGTGDTSGFGGLVRRRPPLPAARGRTAGGSTRSVDALEEAYPRFDDAIERVVVDRGELTLHIVPERIAEVCQVLRDDPALRFELCSSVSGVDYLGAPDERRLHVVYHLTSMTYRRRIRLECAVTAEDPHLPSVTSVYPTADWQERETYDMFGIIFDGHPGLTRILMPDDWEGYPQRKDYPLGGVPVEYKGAEIPPPDQRRSLPVSRLRGRLTTGREPRDHRGQGLHRHRRRLGHGRRGPRPDRATSGSSSTWARSTRPPTACCGWCWSWRARRSPRRRPVVGYLHTGIEKNLEFRNWTQGTTFVTRMDYLAPMFNETGVLPRGGEAARHHRPDPASGPR